MGCLGALLGFLLVRVADLDDYMLTPDYLEWRNLWSYVKFIVQFIALTVPFLWSERFFANGYMSVGPFVTMFTYPALLFLFRIWNHDPRFRGKPMWLRTKEHLLQPIEADERLQRLLHLKSAPESVVELQVTYKRLSNQQTVTISRRFYFIWALFVVVSLVILQIKWTHVFLWTASYGVAMVLLFATIVMVRRFRSGKPIKNNTNVIN
jgi:hypothetical protein